MTDSCPHCRRIARAQDQPSYTCPVCQTVIYHPCDVAERYCNTCNAYTDPRRSYTSGTIPLSSESMIQDVTLKTEAL